MHYYAKRKIVKQHRMILLLISFVSDWLKKNICKTEPSIRLIDPIYFCSHSVTNLSALFSWGLSRDTFIPNKRWSMKTHVQVHHLVQYKLWKLTISPFKFYFKPSLQPCLLIMFLSINLKTLLLFHCRYLSKSLFQTQQRDITIRFTVNS